MRPSDHLLVLWQWDTAVRLHRRAQALARTGHSAEWGHVVTLAVIEGERAAVMLEASTHTAGITFPSETGRGF